jgi:hypothetical protein
MGHISRDCTKPRKQTEKYGNHHQQQQERQEYRYQRESVPSYTPHPDAKAALLSGNKRTFNPTGPTGGTKRPFVPDPSKARSPTQGTDKYTNRASAAYTASEGDDTATHYTYSANYVQQMMDQQEQDETLEGYEYGN